jgi:hypothetical protein
MPGARCSDAHHGGDPDALDALAATISREAASVERTVTGLRSRCLALPWTGGSADGFRAGGVRQLEDRAVVLVTAMRGAARILSDEADGQRRASDRSAGAPATGHLAGEPPARAALPGVEVLTWSDEGDGRFVGVVGDLGAARHVAVIVPGMDTDLADVRRLVADAERLRDEASVDDDVAVVAWLGYDAPSGLQAARIGAARQGAAALAAFTAELRSMTHGSVTVIGHSYGSTVVGLSAGLGLTADRVVFVGSPGTGVERAASLGLPPRAVFAAAKEGDPVALLRHFGNDPTAPSYGAVVVDAGIGFDHSGYFSAGSVALANIARVVRGEPPSLRLPTALEQRADGIRSVSRSVDVGLDELQRRLRPIGVDPLTDARIDQVQRGGRAAARTVVGLVDLADDAVANAGRVMRRLAGLAN